MTTTPVRRRRATTLLVLLIVLELVAVKPARAWPACLGLFSGYGAMTAGALTAIIAGGPIGLAAAGFGAVYWWTQESTNQCHFGY